MKKGLKTNLLFFICGLLFIGVFFAYSVFIAKPTRAATGINQTINFQGRLLNNQGATVPDGFYNIQFKIYQDGDGQTVGNTTGAPAGSLKWTENYLNANTQGVKVVNGYLSVQLGSVTAFGSNIDWNQSTLWLSMNIGNTNTSCTPFASCSPDGEMVPMQPLTSAPYAFNSGALGGLTSSQFIQLAQGVQTDASNVTSIYVNKTGSANILDLQASGNSVFVLSNTGAATFTSSVSGALLVRNTSGTGFLSVDTSNGTVRLGVTGATSANSIVHIADSSSGVQTVTIGSTSSTSATTIQAGSGGITLNGNITQSGTGTFSTGSGAVSLNGDTTIAANKNFTQSGTGTFSTGSGTNTLNGNTTVAGTSTFAVNGGNTTLGANLDVTGSAALKKGADFSTTGTTNNASFGNASLIRLTGGSAQTITGIAGGRDGYVLTLVNAGAAAATINNNDTNSSAANRITTGSGNNISFPVGSSVTLVYDSTASLWRINSGNSTTLQTTYNNSVSPQITLSSANGGLVVQDASSPIGADLFTVQSNGAETKYLNVTSSAVAISNNLTVGGTYNTNTFNSTTLQFGGASGSVSSSAGNLTIQAASTNSLILDTAGAGTVSLAGANAATVNIATSNVAHNIHIGDGGTSTTQTITIGSNGSAASSLTLNAGSSGGINANGSLTINGNATISGTNSFSTGSGSVSLNGDTTIAANKNFTQSGTGTFSTGSGANSLNGDTTIAANKNFTQSGTGTFSTGSGANSLNGDTTIAANKNFTQSGTGTFSTGSGTNTLNGNTTVAGTSTFAVNGGNTTLGANLDITGSTALKKGTDFSTTGTTNNASFGNASLIRLTGASNQTITGIAGGRDGYILTLINAGSVSATLTNNDSNSSATNRIITGTGGNISLQAGATLTLVYDSTAAVWRADSANGATLQTAYNNSTTSPQLTLSSANGGLVVQDASSAIGADLFTVQSNGGATKYLNVDATTVAVNNNLTVSGTYNTNTFTSTSLQFGGASGSVSSSAGNLTIQASSTNSLILDTAGAGTVSLAGANATTINVGTSNVVHNIHIGDGGTSTTQTITIGSTGSAASSLTLNAGSSGGINANGSITINGNATISGTNAFSTGSGAVSLNGDTTIAANKNFTQSGTGTFSTGSGANSLNGDTTIAANKNFTQSGTGTFSTGSGANSLNGDTTIAANKNFTQSGTGTFSTGSGTNTLNGNTTVAGTSTFAVNGGNTTLGANLDITGSTALKKGTDFSTTGTTNNASFGNASLIRLTGGSAQTITGIAGGRDGYVLTLVNAGSVAAVLNNNDSNSSAGNRITTGTSGNVSLPVGSSVTLVYDSTTAVWRSGSVGGGTLQSAYNNSTTSPQITLSSANGGLVVQDASSAIGADLFTVQSNGGATKYFNVDATTVAINNNLTVSGTYNTNTFTSTSLQFGGASGSISSSAGNLTIQAASTNSLMLDTAGAGTVSLATGSATTVNIATNNIAHAINIGTGGTSTAQTIAIGSTGAAATSVTINAGSSGGITLNGTTTVSGSNSFSTGTGNVALNGDTTIAANKNFTQNGTGTFSTGTGANTLNGDTTIAANKNFTQNGTGTFSTGTGANFLNGNTTIASGKTFTALGTSLFKDSANSASAFQVQNNSSFNVLAVDTSANHLKVYDGTATQAYVDIYYDAGTSSAVIAASTGTTKVGNGSGPITLNAGAGAAVNIAGHAASTWSVDSGDLTIDVTSSSSPNLNLGTGSQSKTINIGNGAGTTALNVQCGTGVCGFGNNATDHSTTVGSTSGTSLTTIRSGSGGITLTGNTTVSGANTFSTGTGNVSLNGNTTVASGRSFTANGAALFQSTSDSTTAFQIKNNAGTTTVFNADTTNGRVGVGTATPNESLQASGAINIGTTSNTNAGTIRWTGTDFQGYDGAQWKSMTTQYLSVNPVINTRKGTNECVNSAGAGGCAATGTTLQDDDELFFAVGANETWTFRFLVFTNTPTAADLKFSVTSPSGSTCTFGFQDAENAQSIGNVSCASSTSVTTANSTNTDAYDIVGTVVNGGTPGNVRLQWAQNTANTTATNIYSGSFLQANRNLSVGDATLQSVVDNGNSFAQAMDVGTNDAFDLNLRTAGNTIATFTNSNGAALFKNSTNGTTAFQIQNSTAGKLFIADTTNSRIYVGDSAADATGVVLVLDTSTSSTEPTGVNGAIYYSDGGNGGAGGASSFAGKFRCFEGNLWKNCIGMRDIAERRWGYAAPQGTTSTAFGADGLFTSTILGAGAAGTVASSNQAESNYISYPTTASNGTKGGFGNTFSATATQTRWLPKLVTRVRVDASAVTSSRIWVALASADLSGSDGTGSYIGLRYSTAAGDTTWQCASRDGTTASVTNTGVTVTAGQYYDIIVDLTTAGTLVCSVSANGGAYTTVTKTTNLPATSTSLGLEQTITTLTTAARTLSIAYSYLEFQ